ncbi:MAG: hypothetical protein IT162_22455 [Bryobacterales bacterium]|nr:hypothetical protein [Bryobacterales bacterium]
MIARPGLLLLLEAFDRLEIAHMIVGSTVSSAYGFFRATADVDIVVDLRSEHVDSLAALLQPDFYADAGQMRDALRFRRSFNVIHLATAYKFDLFTLHQDAYARAQFARRLHRETAVFGGEALEVSLCTPEDIVLNKLRWYRQGGMVSDRQWHDILGVITIQRDHLDLPYLRQWAEHLNVSDLLEAALTEKHGD